MASHAAAVRRSGSPDQSRTGYCCVTQCTMPPLRYRLCTSMPVQRRAVGECGWRGPMWSGSWTTAAPRPSGTLSISAIWVTVIVVAAVLVGVISWFLSRQVPQREIAILRQFLESAREEAARLPDSLQCAERAETDTATLRATIQNVASREAAAAAALVATSIKLEELKAAASQTQARTQQWESDLTDQRHRADTATANLVGAQDRCSVTKTLKKGAESIHCLKLCFAWLPIQRLSLGISRIRCVPVPGAVP